MTSVERICSHFENPKGKVAIGIDGCVDEVWNLVSYRKNTAHVEFFEKLEDFVSVLSNAGAGGVGVEAIRKRRSYGGFTANTGRAVGRLGVDLTLIAMFGKCDIDPVFRVFQDECEIISIGNPYITQIYEFLDGKMMFSSSEEAMSPDWNHLTASISNEILAAVYGDADIVGLGYWSNMIAFNDIVMKICDNFIKPDGEAARMFFDFADIRKREKSALEETLQILGGLNKKVPMTLSLNEHEGAMLFSLYGKEFAWQEPSKDAEKDIELVRNKIGLDELIVHTPFFAIGSSACGETAAVLQHHCKNPVITTGAGDNFNGGYIAACVSSEKLNLQERLLVGNATTRFYVRSGYTPNADDIKKEIKGELL